MQIADAVCVLFHMWWKQTPAVPAALGLLCGCASADSLQVIAAPWLWGLGFLGGALFLLGHRSVGLVGLGLALGWGLGGAERQERWTWQAAIDVDRPVILQGQVRSHGSEDEDGWRCLLAVDWVQQGELRRPMEEAIWLRLPRSRPPVFGEHLQVKGYLRRGAQQANGAPPRPRPWSFRVESERLLLDARPGTWPWRLAELARQRASVAIHQLEDRHDLGPWGTPWLRALLLGDRQGLALHHQQGFRRLGLAHLLAVSGLHLAMVLGGIWVLGSPLPWRLRVLLGTGGTVFFAGLIGMQPSIARAAVMACLGLFAWVVERPPQARNSLALTVLALLVLEPGWAHHVGFCLSVSATAGILWWTPAWTDAETMPWNRLPRPLRGAIAATLAAQLATLPWMWSLHGGFHPLSVVLNLVALPWLALFLTCGLTALLLALSPWTLPAAWPLAGAIDGLSRLAAWACEAPASSWHWSPWPDGGWVVLALTAGWGLRIWAEDWPRSRKRRSLRAAPLLALVLAFSGGSGDAVSEAVPELVMFDVGQGDALMLRDGDEALLVDGGGWRRGDAGGRILWPILASLGLPGVHGVLITHGDTDHCAGVRDVLRYVPVEEVWMTPGGVGEKSCPQRVLETPGPRWRPLWRGDRLQVGRWQVRVLSPGAGQGGNDNDLSLVIEASVHGRRILLTGDIEAASERRLVRRLSTAPTYDVLKVAHHGSKTSTSRAFLDQVRPRLALISAGLDNTYGHPTPEVLQRLRRHGAVVLRTDRSGLVRLQIPAEGPWKIETPASPRGDLPPRPR